MIKAGLTVAIKEKDALLKFIQMLQKYVTL